MKRSNIWRGMTALLAVILCLTAFGTGLAFERRGDVNNFLGTLPPKQAVTADTDYCPSRFASKEMEAALTDYMVESQIEGSVLLRSENDALPLSASARVTLFGFAAATPLPERAAVRLRCSGEVFLRCGARIFLDAAGKRRYI